MNQKGFVNIIVIVLAIALASAAGYFALVKKSTLLTSPPQINNKIAPPSQKPIDETANWKTYKNEEHGFEFKYSSEAILQSANASRWTGTLVWPDGSSIELNLFDKGRFPRTNTNTCAYFNLNKQIIDKREIEIIQRADCDSGDLGALGALRASGLSAIIPIVNNKELHVGIGEYGKSLSEKNNVRISSIISTFKFSK